MPTVSSDRGFIILLYLVVLFLFLCTWAGCHWEITMKRGYAEC